MEVKTFGVIGSGQMGNGIAQVAAASRGRMPSEHPCDNPCDYHFSSQVLPGAHGCSQVLAGRAIRT